MRARHIPALLPLLAISNTAAGLAGFDVLDHIDPLIGTVNGGKNDHPILLTCQTFLH